MMTISFPSSTSLRMALNRLLASFTLIFMSNSPPFQDRVYTSMNKMSTCYCRFSACRLFTHPSANPARSVAALRGQRPGVKGTYLNQLQNHLSFPKAKLNVHNVSIGNMVFQVVRTGFPLRIAAGMTRMGSFAITS
jgi:hypothetical protein